MKKSGFGLALFAVLLCSLLSFRPLKVHAETIGALVTVELTGTGSLAIGPDAAYPYYMSIDSSGNISMMCVSYDNDISQGESWVAEVEAINTTQLKMAAWLFNDDNVSIAAGNDTQANDDQWAAWEIFSTNAQNATPPDPGAAIQLAAAENAVATNTEPAIWYQQFIIMIPQWGWPGGDDVPQNFIGYADSQPGNKPPDSPEPGSLLLLGTGMFGVAAILYRKKRLA